MYDLWDCWFLSALRNQWHLILRRKGIFRNSKSEDQILMLASPQESWAQLAGDQWLFRGTKVIRNTLLQIHLEWLLNPCCHNRLWLFHIPYTWLTQRNGKCQHNSQNLHLRFFDILRWHLKTSSLVWEISINITDQHVLSILYRLQLLVVALNYPLTLMTGIG